MNSPPPLNKQKIVLLHGWGCDSRTWAPILPPLQKLGEVIAIDLPGFGESAKISNYSLNGVVDFIAQQLPDSGVLIGWSLGGMLAVQIAARYPHKVSKIITLAANIKFVAGDDYLDAMHSATNHHFTASFENDPHGTLKIFSGLLVQGDANERALLKKIRALIAIEAVNANWLQALQLLSQLDNRAAFTALAQPGLHLLGEADVLVPASAAPALSAANTRQKIILLPQTCHAVHWSQPEKVMAYIQDFFQRNQTPLNGYDDAPITFDPIEKKRIAQSFSRAAHTYDSVAKFQRNVGEKLLHAIECNHTHKIVLDLGCGTGYFTRHLQEKFSQAKIMGLDIAEGMLSVAQEKNPAINTWLCGDAEKLPLANASVDVIFSSLALQWCHNLPELFAELNRVLKPGGTLIFSTLGPDTLHELKSAWQRVDNYVHVNRFRSCEDIKKCLLENSFLLNHFEQQLSALEFEKLADLTRELKFLGAHNINRGRAAGLTGRKKIAAFKTAYESFRRDNLLPATYDVFYIIAEKRSRY